MKTIIHLILILGLASISVQGQESSNATTWTRQKIQDLKASIARHPYRYGVAGAITLAAIGGICAYKFGTHNSPVNSAGAQLSIVVIPAAAAQLTRDFFTNLSKAIHTDKFMIENAIATKQNIGGDLYTNDCITRCPDAYVPALCDDPNFQDLRAHLPFIQSYVVNPPVNQDELASLAAGLNGLSEVVDSVKQNYN